ncbi:MAG: response regulator transcription factor [Oscillospiraceae bacterium]|nr:response regulator transcription factor [Oscillospiraceae bacterium]
MKTVLCVEDDLKILYNNRDMLTEDGYNVLTAETLSQARQHLSDTAPDVIVLDIMLPDGNGLEFLKELRAAGNNTPVIMLTAWNRSGHIVQGLDSGANDYIGKPFEYEVLLARIKALFRNIEYLSERIVCGILTLSPISGQAFINGEDLLLTQKEFALLLMFVQNEGKTVSTEYLYEKVWGLQIIDDMGTVNTTISRLRKKIEPSGYYIFVTRNKGYTFDKT